MHYILAFGVILVALVFWITSVKRSLAGMTENINNAMSQIGLQLSSQCEILSLILDLIEWYAGTRKKSITKIMREGQAITKYSLPEDVLRQKKIIARVKIEILKSKEHSPKLGGDDKYIKAVDALQQYEKMIETSILIYNDSAAKLNQAMRMFPACMIAGILGFSKRKCFEEGR